MFELKAGEFLYNVGSSFLTHKPGQPTLEQTFALPPIPTDPALRANHDILKAVVAAASSAQEGCQAPCTDPADIALYRGKIELIARKKLGLTPSGVAAALENYLPRGVPRIRAAAAGAGSRESRLLDAEVVQHLLTSPGVAANVRQGLGRKAIALADALGQTQIVTADAQGFATLPNGQRSRLTAEELAALNRVPAAQASYLRRLATSPPPPTVQERSDAAMREADQVVRDNPGNVREALNYWTALSQDTDRNPLVRGIGYLNRGLLGFSGLADVEDSAGRLGYATASQDVTTRRTVWEGVKAVGNAGLFAANFVGLSGGVAVVNNARKVGQPVVVEGVHVLAPRVTEAVIARSAQVTETVATGLAQGGTRNYTAATEAMNQYARTNLGGVIRVERGGKIGQADFIADEMAIKYSPFVGESHEFAHAVQMFTNRTNALEITAQRLGKTASTLQPAEVQQAMALAKRFETGYYSAHEAQALRSSGFMGLFPGQNYAAKLATNGDELTRGITGLNPNFNFTRGQRVFGALSGLGDSQAKIAGSVVTAFNAPWIKDYAGQAVDITAAGASAFLPPPTRTAP